MSDVARLGLDIDSSGAKTGAVNLDALAASAAKADAAAKALADSAVAQARAELEAARAATASLRASEDAAKADIEAALQKQKLAAAALAQARAEAAALAASRAAAAAARAALTPVAQQGALAADAVKLTTFQTANLAAQLQDIAVQMQSGQNPLQIALQQGTQINQVIGQQGVRGGLAALGAAFTSLINPVSLLTIGLIAGGGALVQFLGSLTGGQEAQAEAALERQKALINDIAQALPEAGKALKEYLSQGQQATPNEIVLRTSQEIKDAKAQLESLKQSFNDLYALAANPVTQGGSGFLGGIDSGTAAQIKALVDGLNDGTESASRLRDNLAQLSLRADLPQNVQDLVTEFYNLAQQISVAETNAEAFSSLLDALRANGGAIISGDFAQLGGDTQKAYDALKSVIDSGKSQKDRLRELVDRGVGGATSLDDAARLQAMLAQAEKVLDQKDAAAKAAGLDKSYQRVTDSLERELDALHQTDREQQIANALAQAHVTAASKQGQAITTLAGDLYDQKKALDEANQTTAFFAQTIESAFEGLLDGSRSVTDSLGDMVKALEQAVLQAALLGTGPLGNIFGGAPTTSGQTGGFLGSLFSGLGFGGGRAAGGPVTPGAIYRINENTPNSEYFAPAVPGYVIPSMPANNNAASNNVQVIVENHSGSPATTKREKGPGGQDILRVIVGAVARDMTSPGGQTNRAQRLGFGAQPVLTRR